MNNNIIFLILLIVILVILYNIKSSNNNNISNNTKQEPFHNDIRAKAKNKRNVDYLNDLLKYSETYHEKINPEFVEMQFHDDYRDALTAFNNIAPSQKQIFNIANLPVKFTNPPITEVKQMVNDFVYELNRNIHEEVSDFRNNNTGWDELAQDKQESSGWDKAMANLGLPKSLYKDPAKKGIIRLIKIDHLEKYESEDEIKYSVYLIMKKKGVEDQLVVKVSFVLDKKLLNDERNVFLMESDTKSNSSVKLSAVIEEIFILGFMVKQGIGRSNRPRDKFYNFKALEKDGILDQDAIISELNLKLKERSRERDSFLRNLDDETLQQKIDTPNLANLQSYQATQTIYDDILSPRRYF